MAPSQRDSLTIIVGVTGGIAAYKAVGLIRALVCGGHSVHVIATEAALRFVGKPTFEAISRNPVTTDLYDGVSEVRHVAAGASADLILIAPATANTIAKVAHGLADDLLSTTVLASTAPLVIAPAMHTEMWENPATVENIATLRRRGAHIIGPAVGALTGSDSGPGRLEEPDAIVASALAFHRQQRQPHGNVHQHDDLAGRRIVVTAGGTREPLDPVRFFGNRSSGKQGIALARSAARRGATVVLIAANCEIGLPDEKSHENTSLITVRAVSTANELHAEVRAAAVNADIVIMAAAVADFRPVSVADVKIKKENVGERITVELMRNPDILADLVNERRPDQVIVGFAAQTANNDSELLAEGRSKLQRKNVDYLVVNRVGWNEGFSSDNNAVLLLDRAGSIVMEASGSKVHVAERILDIAAHSHS